MRKNTHGLIYIVLLVIILLRLIPILYPASRTWGFNHLIFMPAGFIIGFFCLALVVLVFPFYKKSEDVGIAFTQWFSEIFYEHKLAYLYRLIFIALMTFLFIYFSATTHFLGDGYALLHNIASETGTFIKWSEQGITWILLFVQSLIGPKNLTNSLLAFQIVSITSGIITFWIFFLIAGIVTNDAYKRFLVFGVLAFSPVALMFFGYVESYPLLWIGFSAFLYFGILYIKSGRGLLGAIIFLLFNIFIHLQMIVLIPALVYLLFCRGYGYKLFHRFKAGLITAAAVITVLGIMLFARKYNTDLYIENMFLPLFRGKPIYPVYSLISWPHLLDVANLLLLLSPLLPLFLFISFKQIKRIFRQKDAVFFLIVALGTFCFLFFIDPKLTMARDWDLFSTAACGFSILFILLIHDSIVPSLKKFTISLLAFFVILPMPYFLANLNEWDSIEYIKYIINTDLEKSFSSIFVLNQYLLEKGYTEEADSLKVTYNKYPFSKSRFDWAIAELDSGNVDKAWSIFRTTLKDRFDQNYHVLLKELYLREKDYDKALDHATKAIQLQSYADYLYAYRGEILLFLKRYDEALADFRKGYKLNSGNLSHLEGMAAVFFRKEMPDSGIYYTRRMIELDSNRAIGYYMLAMAYIKKKDLANAQMYTSRYAKFVYEDSALKPLLNQILSQMEKAGLH